MIEEIVSPEDASMSLLTAPRLVSTATFPRLEAPVVMTHGLFGFHRIGWGPVTLAWYFRGIPEAIEAAGNRVFVPRVHPTAGIERRARKLGERILGRFPDGPIHLVGHSMGGLDARALLMDPYWQARVVSLTTIASPHLGSSIADFAKLRVGRIFGLLERLGIDHRGFSDLSPRSMEAFNRTVRPTASIPCFSIAGEPEPADICWPLRRLHAALDELEGPNDGLVSTRSALAFGQPLPDWPLDHLRQMNWFSPGASTASKVSVLACYADLLANLAEVEQDRLDPSGWPVGR